MNQSLLATGINGLVGSKFSQDFANKYSFDKLDISSKENPVDITKEDQVFKAVSESDADFIVHLAAYTDVTGAWKQKDDKSGLAYQVNVVGTQNIINACNKFQKHLIHISTAYVFDGDKEGFYTEEDRLSPIEWYGQTKAEAETLVQSSEIEWTILRIDQPFRSDNFAKADIVRRIATGLKNDNLYPQFDNHFFGPTFIDDFSLVMDWVVRTGTTGVFNASSGEKWTDYDFAQLINSKFEFNKELKRGDLNEYLKTLDRPYQKNTAMSVDKLKAKIDFKLNSVEKALSLVTL